MRSTAFCPGHITGFFQVCEHGEIDRMGSRGAGMCICLGATTTVTMTRGRGRVEVVLDGRPDPAPVTRQVVAILTGNPEHDIRVETRHDLPVGQGFGMSAAGALSTALAICEVLGCEFDDAVRAAHRSEVLHRSGLGDVAALSRGGITLRRREGIPPHGIVDRIGRDLELVIAVVGPEIPTSRVLGDPKLRERIDQVGRECVHSLEASPSLANLFRLSRDFAARTGLATPEVEAALAAIDGLGPASMVMLGNSVFASGEVEAEHSILSERYPTQRVRVDWHGPRVIDSGS